MVEGLRRTAKKLRHRYVFGALFLIAGAAYAFVLLRGLASAAAYKDATATIVLTEADATAYFASEGDANSREVGFDVPHGRLHGVPAVDYVVNMTAVAHLLRPEFNRPRQLVLGVRRSATMPARSTTRVILNGTPVGTCSIPHGVDQSACEIDPSQDQSPPADEWHIRLEDRRGGMIVSRVVVVIGR